MISLLTFIQTGRLGEIGLGSTREEVEAAFGSPPSWDGRLDRKRATIWKYGAFEIYFSQNLISMIVIGDLRANLWMINRALDANGLNNDMDEDGVELWLMENELNFEKRAILWCGQGVAFRVASGVELQLCADELRPVGKPWKSHLCSLLLSRR